MKKINKQYLKSSDKKLTKEEFKAFANKIEIEFVQPTMCLILQKIVEKKGFDSNILYDEIAEIALKNEGEKMKEYDVEFIANKIIRGKNLVEM